jgi:purine-cytosine permease-like protein
LAASDVIAAIALLASVVAVVIARAQAGSTRWQAVGTLQQAATAYAATITSFVSRFVRLIEREDPNTVFTTPAGKDRWIYEFWDLIAQEFYFFHHRMLPVDMFGYWMGALSELYAGNDAVYRSHKMFLASYVHTYPKMGEFFERISNLAENNLNPAERNRRVQDFVSEWIKVHRENIQLP